MPNISPVLLRGEIARRPRAARKEAGIQANDAADSLDISRSSISRIEMGQQRVTVHLVRSMMDLYDFRDNDLLDMVRESRKPGWWKAFGISDNDFIALETGAARACTFDASLVHGLLQTADYASAVFESGRQRRTEEQVANDLEVRLMRQERLSDEKSPLSLVAIIDEHVLQRPVGEPKVMRAQLRHLALVAEMPTVTLQVLPTSVIANDSVYGSFIILDFPSQIQPAIAYTKYAFGEVRNSNPETLHAARLRFDNLRSAALDPDQSVALIEQVCDELWPG